MNFPKNSTIADLYDPAMKITEQGEADRYFAALIEYGMGHGQSRDEAEAIQRENLGYYAGYYGGETRARTERLFRCAHPVFGSVESHGFPTAQEAFDAGVAAARAG